MKRCFNQIRSIGHALAALISIAAWHPSQAEPPAPGTHPLLAATKENPWANELGMSFIPLPGKPGVFMCRTETRVRDFQAYATATGLRQEGGAWVMGLWGNQVDYLREKTATWENPGFVQAPDHPVCCVNWKEARAFCAWLSSKDPRLVYRLPSEEEWAAAMGAGKFPWGDKWWPRPKWGNVWGKEAIGDLPGRWGTAGLYNDGFVRTSPVASFPANEHGFFDLGGNVGEWCEDRYQPDKETLEKYPSMAKDPYQVVRGSSWADFSDLDLLLSHRSFGQPSSRNLEGFRCVVTLAK